MKKSLWSALFLSFLLASPSFAAGEPVPQLAPLSPEYLKWVQERDALKKEALRGTEEDYPAGVIPSPIDRSHLASNPPRPAKPDTDRALDRAGGLPSAYDLRDMTWLSPVRNQNPFGTCWAHAAIGSSESNAIRKGIANADTIDLSEMFLAYFVYGDSRPGKSFAHNKTEDILDQGGNSDMSIAFMSRQGNIDEVDLPYPTGSYSYTAPAGFPENYPSSFQLQEAYQFGNASESNRDIVKQMILEHGAVETYYKNVGSSYYRPDSNTTAYFNNSYGTSISHAVLLVGWDDNFPRENFGATEDKWPEKGGAWLVRNSWGPWWGDSGYFWMSYEQYTTNATVYIVKAADNLRHYGHDDQGHVGTTGSTWAANVFRAQGNESVREVAFYTTGHNAAYEAYVYDLGTATPSSPVAGTLLAQWSGTVPYAGYHRVALPSPADVGAKHWFSVVVRMVTNYSYPTAVEIGYWSNVVVNPGESWFSYGGTLWTDGATLSSPMNATIKAFTAAIPLIQTNSLPNGALDKAYNAKLAGTGGEPITWTKASGSLPPGLALSADGRITGTPTKVGTYGFTVKAANDMGAATKALKIIIGEAPTITTTTDNLPGAIVGTNYSATLAATGTRTVTWTSTSLPAGLTLTANGRLSGKPTKQGTYYFTVKAKNNFGEASQTLWLTVGTKPAITTATLQGGVVNIGYNATLAATGTTPITWSVSAGKLPEGLNLATNGRITGSPTKQGTYSVTFKATNKMGAVTKALKIVIGERPTITTTTATLPGAVVNANYSTTLAATGTKAITWSIASGALPQGVTLAANGRLSGKPTAQGTYYFTAMAKNDFGQVSRSLSLTVGTKPVITSATLPGGVVGTGYNATLAATGTTPITWAATGKLPDGLTLAPNGRITGTPAKQGTFNVTFKAENKMGNVTKALKIVIGEVPAITTAALNGAVVNANYSATLAATGTKTITWSLTGGSLPPGVTLAANGRLSGKPTAQGTFNFTVTAKNDFGQVAKPLSLVVGTKPAITTTALPGGTVSAAYNVTLAATGAPAPTWAVSSGKLPDGLSLAANGRISGTPTKKGTYSFTVKATNAVGSVTKALRIVVSQ